MTENMTENEPEFLVNGKSWEAKKRKRKIIMAFAVVVLVCFAVAASQAYLILGTRHNTKQGKEAHDAICALIDDIRARADHDKVQLKRSRDFLDKHPNGIPGIPRKLLQDSVDDQVTAIKRMTTTIRVLEDKVKSCKGVKTDLTSSIPSKGGI